MNLFKTKYGLQQQIERHVKSADIKGKYVLDIGCGSGWIEEMLFEKGAKKIVGIDNSEDVIQNAKKQKLKNVVYKNASAIKIPYKKDTFDVIVSFEVLEHVPQDTEIEMFKEVYRVLKPGGVFYLSTPYKNWFSMLCDPAWWLIGHRHYNEEQVQSFAKDGGFYKDKIYTRGGVYTIALLLNMYFSKWIIKRKGPFYNFLLKKSREEYKSDGGIISLFLKANKK